MCITIYIYTIHVIAFRATIFFLGREREGGGERGRGVEGGGVWRGEGERGGDGERETDGGKWDVERRGRRRERGAAVEGENKYLFTEPRPKRRSKRARVRNPAPHIRTHYYYIISVIIGNKLFLREKPGRIHLDFAHKS